MDQLPKFSVVNEQGQPVSTKKRRQTQPSNINNNINVGYNIGNININNNFKITNNINIFNIPNNNNSVRDQPNNRYVGTDSGHLNHNELIKFIEDIIVERTQDQPAA